MWMERSPMNSNHQQKCNSVRKEELIYLTSGWCIGITGEVTNKYFTLWKVLSPLAHTYDSSATISKHGIVLMDTKKV